MDIRISKPDPDLIQYSAKRGDTAQGVIVKENESETWINTRPCDEKRRLLVFRKPFVKRPAKDIKCGRQSFPRFEFEQR
jgi:hypothetical protein